MAKRRWAAKVGIQYREKDPDGVYRFKKFNQYKKGPKPTGVRWYLRYTTAAGKTLREPLIEGSTWEDAMHWCDRKESELTAQLRGIPLPQEESVQKTQLGRVLRGPTNGRFGASGAVGIFLNSKAAKTLRTQQSYRLALNHFTQFTESIGVKYMEDITPDVLQRFQEHTLSEGYSPKTLENKLMTVALMLKKAGSAVKVDWQNTPDVEEQPALVYSPDVLIKLWQVFDAEEDALFSFFLKTGMREAEVSHAEWSDINWEHHTVTVKSKPHWKFKTKNHKSRVVPVPSDLLKKLKEWKKHSHSDCTLIFPSSVCKPNGHFLRYLKSAAKRAGLNCGQCKSMIAGKEHTCKSGPYCEHYKLHNFRKTFATNLHHMGAALKDLQEWLGHESLETTRIYLGSSDLRSAQVRSLVDKAYSV